MTNDDLSARIAFLEIEIERLAALAEGCVKIILMAKIAIVLGGLALLAIVFTLIAFNPLVLVGSIVFILGGIVAAGSNAATLRQLREDISAAEQARTTLIDQLALVDRGFDLIPLHKEQRGRT